MKSILLLSLLFLLNYSVLGEKTYSLTIQVQGRSKNIAVAGAKVFTTIDGKEQLAGITNVNGILIIYNLTAKNIKIEVTDPKGYFRDGEVYFSNPKLKNTSEYIWVNSTYLKEKKAWKIIDEQYGGIDNVVEEYMKDTSNFEFPKPIGGMSEMMKFIQSNLVYPQDAIENNVQGRVFLSFIVQEDGQITHVKVTKGVSDIIDDEAIRVVRFMKKMEPAIYKGKAVKSSVQMPISVSLN
jgi:TonB family protein